MNNIMNYEYAQQQTRTSWAIYICWEFKHARENFQSIGYSDEIIRFYLNISLDEVILTLLPHFLKCMVGQDIN